jgi:hypothetical protein
LGEVLLGEGRERHARAAFASLRRGQRPLERVVRAVGGRVSAALDPS